MKHDSNAPGESERRRVLTQERDRLTGTLTPRLRKRLKHFESEIAAVVARCIGEIEERLANKLPKQIDELDALKPSAVEKAQSVVAKFLNGEKIRKDHRSTFMAIGIKSFLIIIDDCIGELEEEIAERDDEARRDREREELLNPTEPEAPIPDDPNQLKLFESAPDLNRE